MRDFDLVDDSDQVKDAVEVTSVQLPAARATSSALRRMRERALGLTMAWSINVHETAQVRDIEREAPDLLNQLHARGVERFSSGDLPDDSEVAPLVRRLGALRIAAGFQMKNWPEPRLVAGGFATGSLEPGELTRAVEREMSPNVAKLTQAPAGATRHLFVWLDDSNWYVSGYLHLPVDLGLVPPPTLLAGIDVVWAAVAEGPGARCVGLIRSSGEKWEFMDPPP